MTQSKYKKALEEMIKTHESTLVYEEFRTGDWFNPVEYDFNQKKFNERIAYWIKQGQKK